MKKRSDDDDHKEEESGDRRVTDMERSVSREYQHLDDKEKDAEIVRSILRLQNKIQMMLYFSPALKEGTKQNNLDLKQPSGKKPED